MNLSPLLVKTQRLLFVVVAISTLLLITPVPMVFAESTGCTPPSPTTPGLHVPTGSDAAMYHYDCNQGLWVSAHYTYNPQTNTTRPLDPQVYTYNSATGQWDYEVWTYIASKGDYALRSFSVSTPPTGATTVGGPAPAAPSSETQSSSASSNAAASATGSGVTAFADTSGNSATAIAVTNTVGSLAASGNATVAANTSAGSATTGNAAALTTLVNMLQSTGNSFGADGNAVVFNTTINGDVTGDILLDPALIGSIQPSGTLNTGSTDANSVTHSDVTASVANDISVGATSGNALVAANTNAGSATSGSATAIANVLNFLNSTVVSGKSFIGVITINGNLNGDILLPPNFIDELLASNVPTVSLTAPIDSNGKLDTSVSQSITNAVTATAKSGDATVDKNTLAGDATTGSGTTNITTFNLTGNSVIGKNALLVFVNVLGKWYGLIFNAPTGTTAAALGGTISTAASTPSQIIGQYNTDQTITNNIVANAQSGDATVTKNTNAGDATTGDAKVAVNILNVANSALSLSDWFGILFINVFGSWTGSFGINTIAGTITPTASQQNSRSQNSESTNTSIQTALFSFIPRSVSSRLHAVTTGFQPSADTPAEATNNLSNSAVLAAQHSTPGSNDTQQKSDKVFWIYAGFITAWILLILSERLYSKRHDRS